MFCNNCGKQIKDGSQFCVYCGTIQKVDGTHDMEWNQDNRPNNQEKHSLNTQIDGKTEKGISKKSNPLIVVLSIVSGLVVIGVIFTLVYTGALKKDKSNPEKKDKVAATETVQLTEETSVSTTELVVATEETPVVDEVVQGKIRQKYTDILANAIHFSKWPDEDEIAYKDYDEENPGAGIGLEYAMVDVNQDGREELIACLDKCADGSCAMEERIYAYDPDTDEMSLILNEYPACHYYDNGTILAESSHNQSLGEMFPYTIYQYDTSAKKYVSKGFFSSWEKSLFEEDYAGNAFPDDMDKDGDGKIYIYVAPTGEWNEQYMDEADYNALRDPFFSGATEMPVNCVDTGEDSFVHYTDEYLTLLRNAQLKKNSELRNDLGVWLMASQDFYSTNERMEKEFSKFGLTKQEDPDNSIENGCIDEDVPVYQVCFEDAGSFQLLDKKVDGLSILGIYPGMPEADAIEQLEAFGFYTDMPEECFYVTGDDSANFAVFYTVTNGAISSVSIRQFCSYAG